MEQNFQDVIYEKTDGIAFARINRPDVVNAFRPLTIDELISALDDAWADTNIGVVVLTGTNGNFCSGGDVKTRVEGGYADETGGARLHVTKLHRLIRFS